VLVVFSNKEYIKVVEALNRERGIDWFLKINLSCPNLKLKKLISQDAKATYNLTKSLRKITNKPLFNKNYPRSK